MKDEGRQHVRSSAAMDEGRSLRAALEAAQAKVASLTRELADSRKARPDVEALKERLAHLERSSEERFESYEARLESHRKRERVLRDRLDAAHDRHSTTPPDVAALRAEVAQLRVELDRLMKRLARAEAQRERLRRMLVPQRPGALSAITKALGKPRIAKLEAELEVARAEIARLHGLLGRSSRRR